jgi:hypothetical protein
MCRNDVQLVHVVVEEFRKLGVESEAKKTAKAKETKEA